MNFRRNEALPDQLIELYKSGISATALATNFGAVPSTIQRKLRRIGLFRTRSSAAILRHAPIATIPANWSFRPLTPDKAWLLGLIFGDGHSHKAGRMLRLTSNDPNVIANVQRMFLDKLPIESRERDDVANILFCSVRLVREVATEFAFTPGAMSYSLVYPTLSDEVESHFVRGLLDSDGSWEKLGFRYYSMCKSFVHSLGAQLTRRLTLRGHGNAMPHSHASWRLAFGKLDSRIIGDWLYCDSTEFNRSERKRQMWLERYFAH